MQLQSALQLGQVQFTIAPDSRTAIESALISEAIKAFQARAEAIRATVAAKSYKIVHFSIDSAGMPPPFSMPLMRGASMASAAIPAPEFAGGESRMAVQINGTIELQ